MKKKLFYFLLIFTLTFNVTYSQVMLARWSQGAQTIQTTYPRGGNYVASNSALTTSTILENYSGLGMTTDNRYVFSVPSTGSSINIASNPYLSYTLNFSQGKNIDFNRFVLYGYAYTGSFIMQLRWSVDNFGSSLGEFSTNSSGSYGISSIDLAPLTNFIGNQVEFRIYFYNGSGLLYHTNWSTANNVNKDNTSSVYLTGFAFNNTGNVGIWTSSVADAIPDFTIVSSGGSSEETGWVYNNGVIAANSLSNVSINASDIVSKLNQGALTIETSGSITIASSITSNSTNGLTIKSAKNIYQNSGAKVQTGGGNITYWSDSDNNGQGAIVIGTSDANGGEEIISNGGNILLAGGSDVNTGFAKGAVGFLPWSAKPYGGVSLFHASINAKNSSNTSGGNIVIRGSLSNVLGSVSGRAVLVTNSNVLTQGSGTISIEGDCTNFAGSNPWGVIIEGYSLIEASDGLISLTGTGGTAAANARGIAFSGGTLTSQRPFVNSKNGGEIVFTDKTNSSSANFTGTYFNMGYIGQTQNVADSNYGSGIVKIISDKMQFDGGTVRDNFTQLNTNGEIYLLPYTNSFKASATDTTIPQIFEKLAFGNPVYVQIGKITNTSKVRIGNSTTGISFNSGYQMDIYSGGIEFYKYINPDKLRLFSSSGVTQTQPIAANHLEIYGSGATSLANTSNYIKKLTAGTTTVPVGNLTLYTNEDLLISNSDSSGLIGINSTGYITLRTYSGKNINIDRNIKTTYTGSIALSLYADFGLAANNACDATATGGSINFVRSNANIEIPASARARLFSSSPSNSTLLSNKAIDGVYYRANTNTSTITTPNTGIQALYRVDNVVAIGWLSSISGDRNLSSSATEATYSVLPVSGATSYVWDLPSGLTLISQTGPSITVGVSSTFTSGSISVYALNGCSQTSSRTISIRKAEVPVGGVSFSVTGAPILCSDATATYTATSLTGGSYVWEVPNGITITSGQGTNSIDVTLDSNFTSGLIRAKFITSSYTLDGSYTVSGVAQPSMMSGPVDLCGLTTATYSVTQVSGVSYVWSVPSGMTIIGSSDSSSINVSVTGNVSGNVSVRAQNACGLSTARSLYVKSTPIMGWISGATRVCGAVQATVDTTGAIIDNTPSDTYAYSVVASAGVSYFWTVPSAATIVSGQNTNSITVRYDLANFDSGSITVQGTNSCGVGSPRSLAVSAVTGSILGPTSLCSLTTATYSVPSDLGTVFTWSLPEGMSISSGQGTSSITVSITHPVKFNTDNQVSVQFTTGCGGTRTLSLGVSCSDYTNLKSDYCGATSIDPYQWIYATEISTASEYRFNVYDATGTNLLFSVDRNVPYFRFFGNEFTYGSTYQVKVQVKPRLGVFGIEGAFCNITIQSLPTIKLQDAYCGISDVSPWNWLFANAVTGATGYRFNIYEGANLVTSIDRTVPFFRFQGNTFTYGATYQVRIQVEQNGVYGAEGESCIVTIQSMPTIKLQDAYCGISDVSPWNWMFANAVTGATGYRFNIYEGANLVTSIDRTVPFFRFQGNTFTYGATYQVRIQVGQNGVYGAEGDSCDVTIEDIAITTLTQCGAVINFDADVYPITVAGATGYAFDIYGTDGTTLIATVENSYNYFKFSQISYVLGMKYYVKVRVKIGTQYGAQGAACLVQLNDPNAREVMVKNDDADTSVVNTVMTAYPNPFTTTFSITPIEGETATMFYQVYDVTGKMIESRSVEANEITNHTIGEYYPTGMYLVIVRQGPSTKTFKMVKQ